MVRLLQLTLATTVAAPCTAFSLASRGTGGASREAPGQGTGWRGRAGSSLPSARTRPPEPHIGDPRTSTALPQELPDEPPAGHLKGGQLWSGHTPLYGCHGNNVANIKKGSAADTWESDLNERSYDAWGTVTGSSPAPYQRYCANLGHRQDDESGTYTSGNPDGDGLVYMRARYYEPGTGRFVSEDPLRQGANWFTYCNNDPVNLADTSGRFWHIVVGAVFGGISAAVFGAISGYQGLKLTLTIAIGVIAGAAAAFTGAWIAGLIEGSAGVTAGGAAGGALSNAINTLYDDLSNGRGIKWGRLLRNIGIGGVTGMACGAIGGLAQKNGEIAAAIAGVDGDCVGNAADMFLGPTTW